MRELKTKQDYLKAIGRTEDGSYELDNLRVVRALYKQFKADPNIISADFVERFSQRLTTLSRVATGFDPDSGALIVVASGRVSFVDVNNADFIDEGGR